MILRFQKNGLWGVMKDDSSLVVPAEYDYLSCFCFDHAVFRKDDRWGIVDGNGNVHFPTLNSIDLMTGDGVNFTFEDSSNRFGVCSSTGEVLLDPVFDMLGTFQNNLCVARANGLYGAINIYGDWVVDPVFAFLQSFERSSEVTVGVLTGNLERETYCIVDGAGNIVLKTDFRSLRVPSDGVIPFLTQTDRTKRLWGLVNYKGQVVVEPVFEDCDSFASDRSFGAMYADSKWGLFSSANGEEIMFPKFDYLRSFLGNVGVYGVGDSNQDDELLLGFVDRDANIVEEAKFYSIQQLDSQFFEVEFPNDGSFWKDAEIYCSLRNTILQKP